MPAKFKIDTTPAPPRHRPVGKLGIIDWREDCSSCKNCVKKGCVYGLYADEAKTLHDELGYIDYIYQCKGCLNCIQNCTKNLLTRVVNPEYERLGDDYFTPQIIQETWFQAATGQIPVSGAGYGGRFSGRGFDGIWTDMSEIVRPTRDGIHGREYINTGVEIGRKLNHLAFDGAALAVDPPPLCDVPMPLIFDNIPVHFRRGKVLAAIARASAAIGLKTVVPLEEVSHLPEETTDALIPLLPSSDPAAVGELPDTPLVMVPDGPGVEQALETIQERRPGQIPMVRIAATPWSTERILKMAEAGVGVFHLVFDAHGFEKSGAASRHVKDVVREVHGALVKAGTRDQVTLIASGGIALAEHMAKAVICGADLVAMDLPLVVALECRLCLECKRGEPCQIELEEIDLDYAVRRVINLAGTWHNQLLEMMGAMGIREARRLRGETGRCMFFEDLEADTFGRLFGKRIADKGGAR